MADKYAILQLKRTDETAEERFMNLAWLRDHGMEPNPSHYDVVYVGELGSMTELEDLYVQFNTVMAPGFTGHSMSVSDIIAVIGAHLSPTYFYCDSRGFKPLPTFHHTEVEMLIEPKEGADHA